MASQPVQAVLYRILGNDLPPRYSSGQTLANLRFTLEHEPELPGLEKRWLLNRIVCPDTLSTLQDTIRAARQRFDVIPFEEEAYRQVWTDLGDIPAECHPWSADYQQLPRLMQLRISDYIARFKNQYLMNNNGARNRAIALGLADAEWVLPWDGGCFLPAWAWEEIQAAMFDSRLHYLCVPMHRLLDNSRMPSLEESEGLHLVEPQLAFSRNSAIQFNENLRYGSGPKWQILQRIGLPGPWQHASGWLPWEVVDTMSAPDVGAWQEVGLVLRLSGEAQDEHYVDENALWKLRFFGIVQFTRRIDREVLGKSLVLNSYRCWTQLEDGCGWEAGATVLSRVNSKVAIESGIDLPFQRICWLALDVALNRSRFSRARVLELVQFFCLDPVTAWSPSGLSVNRVPELSVLCPLLDGFTLLKKCQVFSPSQWQDLQQWCSGILDWLTIDSLDFLIRHSSRASACWHHLLTVSLAAFLGRLETCCQVIDNLPGLLVSQFQPDAAPQAQVPDISEPDEVFSMILAWQQLALACSSLDRNLMCLCLSSGHSLGKVFAWANHQQWARLPRSAVLDGSDLFWALADVGDLDDNDRLPWATEFGRLRFL